MCVLCVYVCSVYVYVYVCSCVCVYACMYVCVCVLCVSQVNMCGGADEFAAAMASVGGVKP